MLCDFQGGKTGGNQKQGGKEDRKGHIKRHKIERAGRVVLEFDPRPPTSKNLTGRAEGSQCPPHIHTSSYFVSVNERGSRVSTSPCCDGGIGLRLFHFLS